MASVGDAVDDSDTQYLTHADDADNTQAATSSVEAMAVDQDTNDADVPSYSSTSTDKAVVPHAAPYAQVCIAGGIDS